VIALWCHWQTQTGQKLKKRSSQNKSSGYVQKPVEKSTNKKNSFSTENVGQDPKFVKTFLQEL